MSKREDELRKLLDEQIRKANEEKSMHLQVIDKLLSDNFALHDFIAEIMKRVEQDVSDMFRNKAAKLASMREVSEMLVKQFNE